MARVGRVPLLLLDSNLPENEPPDREITARLYGGGHETRLQQEIVLGIGGSRALEKVGIWPTIRHINEGHAAFVSLEKIRRLVQEEHLSLRRGAGGRDDRQHLHDAHARAGGHRRVHARAAVEVLRRLRQRARRSRSTSSSTSAARSATSRRELFSMAVLAMRLSTHQNAVSRLHAGVSRRLWRGVMPDLPLSEVPIRPITNGVHARDLDGAGDRRDRRRSTAGGRRPRECSGTRTRSFAAAWSRLCRQKLAEEKRRLGAREEEIAEASRILDPRALTIGFARRFATYKRATLLFREPKRLEYLLHQIGRPVQILFAGKAHPRDEAGKEFLRTVARAAERPEFKGRVVFLPDYDMALARLLVAGCDVWLNTPERPREASGTSGMKAAMNGALNLSVLDGWWDEAPHDEAGFVVGEAKDQARDEEVAQALYDALEKRVLPMFFDRDASGLPQRWIDRMIAAASKVARAFSSDRMLSEYLEQCYVPGAFHRRAHEGRRPRAVEAAGRLEGARPRPRGRASASRASSIEPDPATLPPARRLRRRSAGLRLGPLDAGGRLGRALRGAGRGRRHSRSRARAVRLEPAGREGEVGIFRLTHRKPSGEGLGYTLRVRPFHRGPGAPERDGPDAVVGRPEPGSEAILVFGLAGLAARTPAPPIMTRSAGILLHPDLAARAPSASAISVPRPTASSTGPRRRARRCGRCCRSAPPAPATRPTRAPRPSPAIRCSISPERLVEEGLLGRRRARGHSVRPGSGWTSRRRATGRSGCCATSWEHFSATPGAHRCARSCSRSSRAAPQRRLARGLGALRGAQDPLRRTPLDRLGGPSSRFAIRMRSRGPTRSSPTRWPSTATCSFSSSVSGGACAARPRRAASPSSATCRSTWPTTAPTSGRNQDLFQLDGTGRPTDVAGVPPDYFSETGQLWGNPALPLGPPGRGRLRLVDRAHPRRASRPATCCASTTSAPSRRTGRCRPSRGPRSKAAGSPGRGGSLFDAAREALGAAADPRRGPGRHHAGGARRCSTSWAFRG